jgi:hypothetical protein
MPTATEALTAATGTTAATTTASTGAAATAATTATSGTTGAANESFWSGWADSSDKDVREWAQNKNYPDVKTLARTALGLEKLMGAEKAGRTVVLPADEYDKDGKLLKADDAGRKAYYAKIGVPESPDKYDLQVPADNPYPQFSKYISQMFHENGVPARMATQLAKGYEATMAKMETEIRAQEDAKSQTDMQELERSWGSNYQERVSLAQRGSSYLEKEVGGLTDIQKRTLESVLGTPKYMTLMWKIGAGNQEARFAGDTNRGNQFGSSSGEAQARLDAIQADRAAGKINDFKWREMAKPGGELDSLRDQIVKGFAQQA